MDACGECGGSGKSVDVFGRCCTAEQDAQGVCCASGKVDTCGVCDGDGSTCGLTSTLVLQVGNHEDQGMNNLERRIKHTLRRCVPRHSSPVLRSTAASCYTPSPSSTAIFGWQGQARWHGTANPSCPCVQDTVQVPPPEPRHRCPQRDKRTESTASPPAGMTMFCSCLNVRSLPVLLVPLRETVCEG